MLGGAAHFITNQRADWVVVLRGAVLKTVLKGASDSGAASNVTLADLLCTLAIGDGVFT
jgi:hypothetical protein